MAVEQAVALKLFPYSDARLLQRWQQSLVVPGHTFKRPKLELADALILKANCMYELGRRDSSVEYLYQAVEAVHLSAALMHCSMVRAGCRRCGSVQRSATRSASCARGTGRPGHSREVQLKRQAVACRRWRQGWHNVRPARAEGSTWGRDALAGLSCTSCVRRRALVPACTGCLLFRPPPPPQPPVCQQQQAIPPRVVCALPLMPFPCARALFL